MSFLRMSSVGHLPSDQKLKRGEVLLQYTRVLEPPEYTPIPFNKQQVKTIKADLSWSFTKLMKKIHKHDGGATPPVHIKELLWEVEQDSRRKKAELEAAKKAFKDRFTGVKGLSRFGHEEKKEVEVFDDEDEHETAGYGTGGGSDYMTDATTSGGEDDGGDMDFMPPPPPPEPPAIPAPNEESPQEDSQQPGEVVQHEDSPAPEPQPEPAEEGAPDEEQVPDEEQPAEEEQPQPEEEPVQQEDVEPAAEEVLQHAEEEQVAVVEEEQPPQPDVDAPPIAENAELLVEEQAEEQPAEEQPPAEEVVLVDEPTVEEQQPVDQQVEEQPVTEGEEPAAEVAVEENAPAVEEEVVPPEEEVAVASEEATVEVVTEPEVVSSSRPTSAITHDLRTSSRPTSAIQSQQHEQPLSSSRPTTATQGSRPTSANQPQPPDSTSRPTSAISQQRTSDQPILGSRPTSAVPPVSLRPTSAIGVAEEQAVLGSRPTTANQEVTGSRPASTSRLVDEQQQLEETKEQDSDQQLQSNEHPVDEMKEEEKVATSTIAATTDDTHLLNSDAFGYDFGAIRASQDANPSGGFLTSDLTQITEEAIDDGSQPAIIAGSVLVADDEVEAVVDPSTMTEADVVREQPRPYGFLPFLKLSRNGFTKEVRIPGFGDKYVDPPIGWLREKYRFAAPAGVHAFVTLHAYGYVVYAKNNIRF